MLVPPLPNNALLLLLQDESNNEYQDMDTMQEMYDLFMLLTRADPTHLVQDDHRHHCFLAFHLDEENNTVGSIFWELPPHMITSGSSQVAYL